MQARLVRTEQVTDDIITYHLDVGQPYHYSPGQYLEMTVPHGQMDELGDWRQFTLSSSPHEDGLAVTMRYSARPSSFKRALAALRPGDTVNITQATGDFILPLDDATPLVWLAGGIGITPFRSMAAWLQHEHEQRPVQLLHCINKPEDAVFGAVLAGAGISADVFITNGRPMPDVVDIVRQDSDSCQYFISGPEPFVEYWQDALRDSGSIESHRIVTDAFLGYRQ
jgi:ferredoxin-NADP reductase